MYCSFRGSGCCIAGATRSDAVADAKQHARADGPFIGRSACCAIWQPDCGLKGVQSLRAYDPRMLSLLPQAAYLPQEFNSQWPQSSKIDGSVIVPERDSAWGQQVVHFYLVVVMQLALTGPAHQLEGCPRQLERRSPTARPCASGCSWTSAPRSSSSSNTYIASSRVMLRAVLCQESHARCVSCLRSLGISACSCSSVGCTCNVTTTFTD